MDIVGEIYQRGDGVFDWEIEIFPSLLLKRSLKNRGSQSYCSPYFVFKNCSCDMRFYSHFDTDDKECISLRLYIHESPTPISVRCSFGIKISEEDIAEMFSCTMYRVKKGFHCGDSKYIFTSELFRRREELMPRDTLTITATLKEMKDTFLFTENFPFRIADTEKDEVLEKTGFEKVRHDIVKMWVSGENSDILIKVKGTEFKAHKNILAARVPVLGTMFQHDTIEKASGEVTIDDCEPAVFEQLLHYIYTGAPSSLTAENASALYVVADKYLVSEVKSLCVQYMKDTLCQNNYCDVVKLALMYKEQELLETAIRFLSTCVIEVLKSVEWQVFSREHSTWSNEILVRSLELQDGERKRKKRNELGDYIGSHQ